MPDLAGMLMRSSIGALAPPDEQCHDCRAPRWPASASTSWARAGSSASSASARCRTSAAQAVRSERVHASERRARVVPEAA